MSNWDELLSISPIAYGFLKDFKSILYKDGRYDLEEGVYVNIESYRTQRREVRRFESHIRYIDVQYMIAGKEIISVYPIHILDSVCPYDEQKDIAFYASCMKGRDIPLLQGEFLIIKPGIAHMPCVCVDEEEQVRKMVIKIPY